MSATNVLQNIDNYLLDLDGCVWFGDELAPGAAAFIRDLRETDATVGFLTNTSSTDPAGVADKLVRLGIPATAEDVVNPLSVLVGLEVFADDPGVYVLGTDDVTARIAERGVRVVADAEDAAVVVVGKDTGLTYDRLAEAVQALVWGADLVALNLDPNVPAEGGRTIPGVGALAAALSTASGVEPTLVGKPSRTFFEHALSHFGMDPSRTVMVGDRPDVDIRGAKSVGLATVLVGSHDAALPETDIPDLTIEALADLRPRLPALSD